MTAVQDPIARLPKHCPPWCTKDHVEDFYDCQDIASASEHLAGGPNSWLNEICNRVDGRIMREGRGSWDLNITQEEIASDSRGSVLNEPTVDLMTRADPRGFSLERYPEVTLHLTSSEARSLAAALIHLADQIELR
jgi:hypothetical protein